jgi:hypothetical protein
MFSESGSTRKVYAVIHVEVTWRKRLEDAEEQLARLKEDLLGKRVLVTVIDDGGG